MDLFRASLVAQAQFTATARYLGREGKLYAFEVVASDAGGEIGRGRHKRAIVDVERLQAAADRRIADSLPGTT